MLHITMSVKKCDSLHSQCLSCSPYKLSAMEWEDLVMTVAVMSLLLAVVFLLAGTFEEKPKCYVNNSRRIRLRSIQSSLFKLLATMVQAKSSGDLVEK